MLLMIFLSLHCILLILTQYDKFSITIVVMNFHHHTIAHAMHTKRTTPMMTWFHFFNNFLYDGSL